MTGFMEVSQEEMDAIDGGGPWAVLGVVMAADWVTEKITGVSPVRVIATAAKNATKSILKSIGNNNSSSLGQRTAPGTWKGAYW